MLVTRVGEGTLTEEAAEMCLRVPGLDARPVNGEEGTGVSLASFPQVLGHGAEEVGGLRQPPAFKPIGLGAPTVGKGFERRFVFVGMHGVHLGGLYPGNPPT